MEKLAKKSCYDESFDFIMFNEQLQPKVFHFEIRSYGTLNSRKKRVYFCKVNISIVLETQYQKTKFENVHPLFHFERINYGRSCRLVEKS